MTEPITPRTAAAALEFIATLVESAAPMPDLVGLQVEIPKPGVVQHLGHDVRLTIQTLQGNPRAEVDAAELVDYARRYVQEPSIWRIRMISGQFYSIELTAEASRTLIHLYANPRQAIAFERAGAVLADDQDPSFLPSAFLSRLVPVEVSE